MFVNHFADDALLLVRDASHDLVPAVLNEVMWALALPHLQNLGVDLWTVLGFEESNAKSTNVSTAFAAVPLFQFPGCGSSGTGVVCGPTDATEANWYGGWSATAITVLVVGRFRVIIAHVVIQEELL